MRSIFNSDSGFLNRFLGAIWVPFLVPIMWYFTGFNLDNSFAFWFQWVAIISIALYILVVIYSQTRNYITTIEIYGQDVKIRVSSAFGESITYDIPKELIDFKMDVIKTSVFKHYQLGVYMDGERIIEQHKVGDWTYAEMRQVIDQINSFKESKTFVDT